MTLSEADTPTSALSPPRSCPRTDAETLHLWRRLRGCTTLVERELRRRLYEDFSTSQPRFALMAELALAPGGLRMGELSKRLKVAAGSVTTLADQLEREGVVLRTRCPTDRRVQTLTLTPAGATLLGAMSTEHDRWVASLLGALPESQARALEGALVVLEQALAALGSRRRVRSVSQRARLATTDAEAALHLCWPRGNA